MTDGKRKKKSERKHFRDLCPKISDFHVEVDLAGGGFGIYLSGVHSVLDFNSERIELKTDSFHTVIRGGNLVLSVYENDAVHIRGEVEGIEFVYTKGK